MHEQNKERQIKEQGKAKQSKPKRSRVTQSRPKQAEASRSELEQEASNHLGNHTGSFAQELQAMQTLLLYGRRMRIRRLRNFTDGPKHSLTSCRLAPPSQHERHVEYIRTCTYPAKRRRLMDEILPVESGRESYGYATCNCIICRIGSPLPPHMSMLTGKIFSRQTPPLHAVTSTLNSGGGGVDEYACRLRIVRTRSFLTGKISSIDGLGGGPACTLAIASIDGQSDRQGGDEDGEEERHLCLGDGSGTL